MIARVWHGEVPADKAHEYQQYVLKTGISDLKRTPGNRGAWVLHRLDGDAAHFQVLSLWDTLDDIRAFAGDEVEVARYYPEDRDYLVELEPTVTHYEATTLE